MVNYYDSDDVVRWYRGKIAAMDTIKSEEIGDTVRLGAQRMRELIDERNTDTPYGRGETPWAGKTKTAPGRNRTYEMRNAVDSYVIEDSKNRKQGHFGWLHGRQDYFRFQEGGFDHAMTGAAVEGMYALADAAEEVFRDMGARIKQRMKNV